MKRFGLISIVVLGLSACGGDPAPEEATPPAATTPQAAAAPEAASAPVEAPIAEPEMAPQPNAEDLAKLVPMDRVAKGKPGKPGAAIELKHQLAASPVVGQPLIIDFALVPQAASPVMRVMVVTSAGLNLRQTSAARVVRNVEAGSEHWDQIVVVPEDNGSFNVNIIATLGEGSQSLARTFSIPVVVGSSSMVSDKTRQPNTEVDATGQTIQPMPGQESR